MPLTIGLWPNLINGWSLTPGRRNLDVVHALAIVQGLEQGHGAATIVRIDGGCGKQCEPWDFVWRQRLTEHHGVLDSALFHDGPFGRGVHSCTTGLCQLCFANYGSQSPHNLSSLNNQLPQALFAMIREAH